MYSPLSDTSRLLRKHAADISGYSSDRALRREASDIKSILLGLADMLENYITDSEIRADSMTLVESFKRMEYARELHSKSLALLEKALLWKMGAACRKQINKLQLVRKSLNPNNPRCKSIERQIEELREEMAWAERWRKCDQDHRHIYRRKDGLSLDDSGDTGGASTGGDSSTNGDANTVNGDGSGFGGGNYNPDEPRIPAGQPGGGEWTNGDSGGDISQSASSLSISQAGIDFIASQEAFSPTVYTDQAGNPTIGYGHELLPDESYPNGITKDQARQLLANDVGNAEQAVQDNVKVPLTQNQFDALTSLSYIGAGNFARSTLLQRLNQGDYSGAADQFSVWNKVTVGGTLIPSQGLTNRRNLERGIFLGN